MTLLAARVVHVVEDMDLSDFQSDNRPQTYQRYILLDKALPQRLNALNIIEAIDEKESSSRTLGISYLYNGKLFRS